MVTGTAPTIGKNQQQQYVPLFEFLKGLEDNNPLPYQSTFSFRPYLNRYRDQLQLRALVNDVSGADDGLLDIDGSRDSVEQMVAKYFPSLFIEDGLMFLSSPFKKDFVYTSPGMKEILTSDEWELKVPDQMVAKMNPNKIFEVGVSILNTYHGQEISPKLHQVVTLRHIKSGLEKCFKLELDFSHIEVVLEKPLRPLSEQDIQVLLRSLHDHSKWMSVFPPSDFSFEGFTLGSLVDVTKSEIANMMKDNLLHGNARDNPETFIPVLNVMLRNYLSTQDVETGFVGILFADLIGDVSHSLMGKNAPGIMSEGIQKDTNGIYLQAYENGGTVLCEDLTTVKFPSGDEKLLLEKGFKSIVLFCPVGPEGQPPMIFEIGSKTANAFNVLTLGELKDLFEIMQQASDRYLQDMETKIATFIQHQFTSIHPSVKWKFEEIARTYEIRQSLPDFDGSVEEIVFKDLYPLYGQADIVGSSKLRNKFIGEDLIENLTLVRSIMQEWNRSLKLHLLQSLIDRLDEAILRVQMEFVSRYETEFIDLLHHEVHPYLAQLVAQHEDLPVESYQAYLSTIDPSLQIIYRKRKEYEQSVTRLNLAISNLLEKANGKLQKILPHYFEKYKTDGVEYNMYVGQSVLSSRKFNKNHLKEFRIWQLVQMCEITRLVKAMAVDLPIPLQTAQLIFVYNTPLSIRFRMDEKQFDVDGSYNVRYEILKKRIDKAFIKGSDERLTQPGTISIIYLREIDRVEYLTYLKYLIDHQYIGEEFEDLELEKMQGADGLQALRINVLS